MEKRKERRVQNRCLKNKEIKTRKKNKRVVINEREIVLMYILKCVSR